MSQRIPGPEDVGRFHDHFTRFFEIAWGDSLHTGYWPDGEGSTDRSIPEAQVRLTEQVLNQLHVPAGAHVLDVGRGTGEPTLRLSRARQCRVTGITISAKQVETARQRARREGLDGQVQFQHADVMALPFAEATFRAPRW